LRLLLQLSCMLAVLAPGAGAAAAASATASVMAVTMGPKGYDATYSAAYDVARVLEK
jgi:hypothetical protein